MKDDDDGDWSTCCMCVCQVLSIAVIVIAAIFLAKKRSKFECSSSDMELCSAFALLLSFASGKIL